MRLVLSTLVALVAFATAGFAQSSGGSGGTSYTAEVYSYTSSLKRGGDWYSCDWLSSTVVWWDRVDPEWTAEDYGNVTHQHVYGGIGYANYGTGWTSFCRVKIELRWYGDGREIGVWSDPEYIDVDDANEWHWYGGRLGDDLPVGILGTDGLLSGMRITFEQKNSSGEWVNVSGAHARFFVY